MDAAVFKTAFGWAGVSGTAAGIARVALPRQSKELAVQDLRLPNGAPSRTERGASRPEAVERAADLLQKFFSGQVVLFDLPLDLSYYTRFRRSVWAAALAIPHGSTRSYAWVAHAVGNPKAVRAVGQAMAANPVPIIIPCHRVIASSGLLGGFSAGADLKQKLLALEQGPEQMNEGR